MESAQAGWRRTVARTAGSGIPMPAHASALAYFDSYRTARLPQSLTQAQRDAFGAHTYERIDRPGAGAQRVVRTARSRPRMTSGHFR